MEKITARRCSFSLPPVLLVALLLTGLLAPSHVRAQSSAKPWTSTWGTATATASDPFFTRTAYNGNNVFDNQVIRLVVHASLGGKQVRIRLSDELGTAAVAVGAAHIALADTGANIIAGSDRTLTFRGGSPSVIIPAGAPEVSDLVNLDVPPNALLAVSLYFPKPTTVTATHTESLESTYVSPAGSGDMTSAVALPLDAANPAIQQWPLLSGVEVRAKNSRVLVALGSSITDGYLSTVDANHRWTDYLAQRFLRQGLPVGVINASIIADGLTFNVGGAPALARFDRDVLARPGATYVFINDVMGVELQPASTLSDADYAAATVGSIRQVVTRAHAAGLKVYGGTILPLGGSTNYSASFEARRQIVNAFIRGGGGGGFDAFVDFDAVVRDPADPTRIASVYDGGDHHHLSDAGNKVVADTFDLTLFQ